VRRLSAPSGRFESLRALGLVVAATALAFALASAALAYKPETNRADQAFARSAVLKLSDLPTSSKWNAGPKNPPTSQLTCPGYHPKESDLVATGSAQSYFDTPGKIVVSDVYLLKTARMVQIDWQRSFVPGFGPCFAHALDKSFGGTYRAVSNSPLALPPLSPLFQAYRVVFTFSSGGVKGRGIHDFIALAGTRKEATLEVLTNLGPAAQQGAAQIAATQLDVRLARALAARAKL
jgi:hypothetical protein